MSKRKGYPYRFRHRRILTWVGVIVSMIVLVIQVESSLSLPEHPFVDAIDIVSVTYYESVSNLDQILMRETQGHLDITDGWDIYLNNVNSESLFLLGDKLYYMPDGSEYMVIDYNSGQYSVYSYYERYIDTVCGRVDAIYLSEWIFFKNDNNLTSLCNVSTGQIIENLLPINIPTDILPADFSYLLSTPEREFFKHNRQDSTWLSPDGTRIAFFARIPHEEINHIYYNYVMVYDIPAETLIIVATDKNLDSQERRSISYYQNDDRIYWINNTLLYIDSLPDSYLSGTGRALDEINSLIHVDSQELILIAGPLMRLAGSDVTVGGCPFYSNRNSIDMDNCYDNDYIYMSELDTIMIDAPCGHKPHSETLRINNLTYTRTIYHETEKYAEIVAFNEAICDIEIILSGEIESLYRVSEDHRYVTYGKGTNGVLDNHSPPIWYMRGRLNPNSPDEICIHDRQLEEDLNCVAVTNWGIAIVDAQTWILNEIGETSKNKPSWRIQFLDEDFISKRLPFRADLPRWNPAGLLGWHFVKLGQSPDDDSSFLKLGLYNYTTDQYFVLTDDWVDLTTFEITDFDDEYIDITVYAESTDYPLSQRPHTIYRIRIPENS